MTPPPLTADDAADMRTALAVIEALYKEKARRAAELEAFLEEHEKPIMSALNDSWLEAQRSGRGNAAKYDAALEAFRALRGKR